MVRAAVLGVALLAASAGGAQAAPAVREGTLVAVPREDAAGSSEYFLRSGATLRELRLERPPRVAPGARVRVTGEAGGGRIAVTSLRRLAAAPAAEPVAGRRSVLVMPVTWNWPASLTPAAAAAQIAGPTSDWFAEVSGGRFALTATATPWLTIPPSDCEDIAAVRDRTLAAARAAGYEPSAYDHEAILMYGDRALRVVGPRHDARPHDLVQRLLRHLRDGPRARPQPRPAPRGRGGVRRRRGRVRGLPEARRRLRRGGVRRRLRRDGRVGQRGPLQRRAQADARLAGRRRRRARARQAVALAPYAGGAGVRAASVQAGGDEFVLEYRRPAGLDAFLAAWPQATSGVLVREATEGPGRRTYLLDAQPDGRTASPALEPGRELALPGGVRLRVEAASPSEAVVSLSGPG